MKVNLIKVYEYVIYFIVIINLGFLNIYNNLNQFTQRITVILIAFLFILYLFQPKKINIEHKEIIIFIFLILIYIFVQCLLNNRNSFSNLNFKEKISWVKSFEFLLLVFPINEVLNKDKEFLHRIFILGILGIIYKTIGWISFNKLHFNIFPGLFKVRGLTFVRYDNVRLDGTFLDGFLYCYALIQIYNKRYKYLFPTALLLFYAWRIFASRTQLLCYLILILVFYLFIYNKNKVIVIPLILILLCLFLALPAFQSYLNTFSVNDPIEGIGTQVRLQAFQVYKTDWLQHSWLGFGIIRDGITYYNLYSINHYYLSDLGIFQELYKYGIFGFVLLLVPILTSLIIGVKNRRNKIGMLIFLFTVYILITSFTTWNVYDQNRILVLPLLFGLCIYEKKEVKEVDRETAVN